MPDAAEGGSDDAHDALIEEFGTHIGRAMGWPRMAGRTAGVLMLSEKPLTLGELQDTLDASKGSVSETTRLLIANGTVERFKETGQRHFVYRWRDDAWIGCLQHIVTSTTQLRQLSEHAQERGAGMPEVQRERLREMHEYYRFMVGHLETLLADYTAGREERKAR
ncbi:GbsR/MarR family transcriptional regulator [Streptomyces sp. NPDC056721]|uniref:GbsR/MarR family transcriptional regulator n=1 Tax=unclassified Streptomyces TaxID=2593676 RepID=UPI00364351C7